MSAKSLVLFDGFASVSEGQKILGVPLRNRISIPAQKEGFQESSDPSDGVLVSAHGVLFSRDFLRRMSEAELQDESILSPNQAPFALIKTRNLELLKNLSADKLNQIKTKLKSETLESSSKDWFVCPDEKSVPLAEKWLLKGLIKDNEGFMSKHFERKISLFTTKLLINTPVTPNLMTLISVAIGLAGAMFFLPEERIFHITGAVLFWLHSVLDGCDGEIARLKFLESRFGGILDFWGDNVVHSAVFLCIAVGYMDRSADIFAPLLGILAVTGTLCSAGLVYWTSMRPKKGTGPLLTSVSTSKFIDFLARRDFIYLVILLSIFGKIHWFLWMGAVGSPIYFMILAVLNLKQMKESS